MSVGLKSTPRLISLQSSLGLGPFFIQKKNKKNYRNIQGSILLNDQRYLRYKICSSRSNSRPLVWWNNNLQFISITLFFLLLCNTLSSGFSSSCFLCIYLFIYLFEKLSLYLYILFHCLTKRGKRNLWQIYYYY